MFYIFHGDDTLSIKETLADLIAKLGDPSLVELNTTRFDKDFDFGALQQACESIPFLTKRRLVIVEEALQNAPRTLVDQLADYLPHLPDSARLVFIESQVLCSNHRLVRLAQEQKKGFVRAFSRPEGGALNRWVEQRVEEKGGQITPRAVHTLVTNIGNEMGILDNEIEKLVLFKNGELIRTEDVARLSPYAAEASIFDLVDALGSRNSRQAAILLQQKMNEGTDPFYLFAMIVRQFRLLIQVKELAEEGLRPPAVSRRLGLHSYVAGKLYQQSQHFSLSQLEQVYAHLLETDVGVKTGVADMMTSLNLLTAVLAGADTAY